MLQQFYFGETGETTKSVYNKKETEKFGENEIHLSWYYNFRRKLQMPSYAFGAFYIPRIMIVSILNIIYG